MNGKKARLLRTIAEVGQRPDTYITTNHKRKLVPTRALNADGTPKTVVLDTCTIQLDKDSPRKFYQTIKRA